MNCTIQRWRISRTLNDRRAPEGSLAAHLAGCPSCRRHFEAGSIIEGRLADSTHATCDAPPFLHARIMAAVQAAEADRAPTVPAHAAGVRRSWAWAAATAAAIAVFALLPLTRRTPAPDVAASPGDLYARGIEAFSVRAPATLAEPLEHQVALFREDIVRTADFLLAQVR